MIGRVGAEASQPELFYAFYLHLKHPHGGFLNEPVILPIIESATNNCEVVDRGQDKGAMIRTSRGIRRAGGGRGWQWGQGRK